MQYGALVPNGRTVADPIEIWGSFPSRAALGGRQLRRS